MLLLSSPPRLCVANRYATNARLRSLMYESIAMATSDTIEPVTPLMPSEIPMLTWPWNLFRDATNVID